MAWPTARSITIRAAIYISFECCFLFSVYRLWSKYSDYSCVTAINSLGNSLYLPFYFLSRYLKPPLVGISYSFQISQQTYFSQLNIFIACIQNRAELKVVSIWTLSKNRHFTFYILEFRCFIIGSPSLVIFMNIWKENIKVIFLSFGVFFFHFLHSFLSHLLSWKPRPAPYPVTYICT